MAPHKRDRFKEWLSGFFTPKNQLRDGSRSFFKNADHFALNDPTITSVQGDHNNTVINIQVDHTTVTQTMSLLSQHIIPGAAYDDSARTPPPRCHPDTRVKLIARITAWFIGQAQHELLLWITGPAGVGKSAIVQTFAEYLAKSRSLGASVFISRPNKRNNPHGIFISIAYQLATRIEEYRKYIAERLSLDPSLLYKGMETQFSTFIIEPFVEKRIGAGGKRWGILLDGLDELQGEDAQYYIIHLVSAFAREHRDVPLVWIIASRPESRISNKFDDPEVQSSCWTEYIPIDSTEACEDVERFLRSSFEMMQKIFRHSVSSDWPSSTDFLKLTAAASGLFVYAEVVMQFIGDSDYADPVSRFEVLLSVIGRSNAVPTKDNPFVHLDALYCEILSAIPPSLWPTAKQLLAFVIHGQQIHVATEYMHLRNPRIFQTLRGMSIVFGITRHVVYSCLNKCRSTLKIPDWKVAHKEKLAFLHASFADYLKDSRRSGDFYISDVEDIKKDMVFCLLEIWNMCSQDNVATAESTWLQYCSKWDDKSPSRGITKFHAELFHDVVYSLRPVAYHILNKPSESLAYEKLCKLHMIKLFYYLEVYDLSGFLHYLMELSPNFNDTGLLREIRLEDLKFGHLDWKEMSPTHTYHGKNKKSSTDSDWILRRPSSSAELKAFVSELEALREGSPQLKVVIFGGVPKGRIAAIRYSRSLYKLDYYMIPYPE